LTELFCHSPSLHPTTAITVEEEDKDNFVKKILVLKSFLLKHSLCILEILFWKYNLKNIFLEGIIYILKSLFQKLCFENFVPEFYVYRKFYFENLVMKILLCSGKCVSKYIS